MDTSRKLTTTGRSTARRLIAAGLAVSVTLHASTPAAAHDPKKHRAKATYGEVVRVTPDAVTVRAEGKETTFAVAGETAVVRDEKRVEVAALKPGDPVAVFSTKLPDGRVAATEINVGAPGGKGSHAGHGASDAGGH